MNSKLGLSLTLALLGMSLTGGALAQSPAGLTALDRSAGWRALFDGESTAGWRAWRGTAFPAKGWEVQDGSLHLTRGGGNLISTETFLDFELELEWRVAPGTNSGIKYRVVETPGGGGPIAPEYQILDDGAHPNERPNQTAGSLYAVYAPEGALPAAVGEWNQTRILARGKHLEHWLNGVRLLQAEIGSETWNKNKAASKFKKTADFGEKHGHILLQDHGNKVWYRNIRVRDLGVHPWTSMLAAEGLTGWMSAGFHFGSPWTRDGLVLRRDAEHAAARLTSESDMSELCAGFYVRGKGELLVGLRQPPAASRWGLGEGAGLDSPIAKPTFVHGERGWFARIPLGDKADKWQHIALYSYGQGLAIDLNHRRVHELHDVEIAPKGRLVFEHLGAHGLELKDLMRMERAP